MKGVLACLLLTTAGLSGQTATFEVASVKRNPAGYGSITRMKGSTGRIDYIAVPLKWLIRQAYRVQDTQISGPVWLDTEGYDIGATYPPATPSRQQSEMWRALLADRFKLAIHRETKEVAVLSMVIAKGGAKLHTVDTPAGGFQIRNDGVLRHFRAQTTAVALAVFLSDQLAMPVVNQTDLAGTLDITLDWSITDEPQPNLPAAVTLSTLRTAVEAQLGLRLEPKKIPMEMVVVDHAEKIPTEN